MRNRQTMEGFGCLGLRGPFTLLRWWGPLLFLACDGWCMELLFQNDLGEVWP